MHKTNTSFHENQGLEGTVGDTTKLLYQMSYHASISGYSTVQLVKTARVLHPNIVIQLWHKAKMTIPVTTYTSIFRAMRANLKQMCKISNDKI